MFFSSTIAWFKPANLKMIHKLDAREESIGSQRLDLGNIVLDWTGRRESMPLWKTVELDVVTIPESPSLLAIAADGSLVNVSSRRFLIFSPWRNLGYHRSVHFEFPIEHQGWWLSTGRPIPKGAHEISIAKYGVKVNLNIPEQPMYVTQILGYQANLDSLFFESYDS